MEPDLIDVALHEMVFVAGNIMDGLEKVGASVMYIPKGEVVAFYNKWQEQLDILRQLDGSNPRRAIYNHKVISQLAAFFGLNY